MTKRLRVWGSLALCVPLALLGACASPDKLPKPAVVVVQSVIESPGKAYVTASIANDGASVVLGATQELRVELALSSAEVANDMDWTVVDMKPGVLTVIGARFERDRRGVNPLEAEGVTIVRLKPQAPGQVRVTFGLRRPHSVGAPARTTSFDVTVKQ